MAKDIEKRSSIRDLPGTINPPTGKVSRRGALKAAGGALGGAMLAGCAQAGTRGIASILDPEQSGKKDGLAEALDYPLIKSIFNRRSRRISKGIQSVPAGSCSYQSDQKAQALSAVEEALLISVLGMTGLVMPDRPFQDEKGNGILGTPNLNMTGRAAGSADNAQNTHFFMINDSGTYYLRPLDPPDQDFKLTPENLILRADQSKKKISDKRLDFPRSFPYYLDSNRFLSNLPGSTLFLPVVDFTEQYINGLMYLLTQPDGFRPVFLDDKNGYVPAGVEDWIKNKYLNPKISLPLGVVGTFRAQIEADLLLQNLMLTLQAMGLGGWIHATFEGPFLMGHPKYSVAGSGLGFKYVVPELSAEQLKKLGVPDPKFLANPVGLDGVIEGFCPPYYPTMSDAVDAVLEKKYGKGGAYSDVPRFNRIFKGGKGEAYTKEVPHYDPRTVQCVKAVCEYLHKTYGRFPMHLDAIYVPGVWLQAHHLDLKYYDQLFQNGYTRMHQQHEELWHS